MLSRQPGGEGWEECSRQREQHCRSLEAREDQKRSAYRKQVAGDLSQGHTDRKGQSQDPNPG